MAILGTGIQEGLQRGRGGHRSGGSGWCLGRGAACQRCSEQCGGQQFDARCERRARALRGFATTDQGE